MDLVGGRGLPRQLRFVKFVCQNERIGSLGGTHPACAPSKCATAKYRSFFRKTNQTQEANIFYLSSCSVVLVNE